MRIVIRSEDPRAARAAQDALGAAGVDATALAGPFRPAPDGEDLIIAPAQAAGVDAAAALVRSAMEAERAPMAALLGLTWLSPLPQGAQGCAPFLSAVALDAPPAVLSAQIETCVRIAGIEEERARRESTAAGFGVVLDTPPPARRLRALYIGAPSTMFLALEKAFAAHDGVTAAAFTSFSGFDHLHDETFDAVVLNGAQNPTMALSLCAALRRNASLHNLPTLMLAAAGDTKTSAAAYERGASAVAELNTPCEPALGWLFEAIRRERRRTEGERVLRALRDRMGDARTGLFLQAPFEAHLNALAASAQNSGRPLALAALRVIPAHGAREPEEPVWRRGFDEIASLAARLVREADCGAAIGRSHIVIALPGADLAGAKRAAERIASVAECTAFAAGEGGAVPLIFEQSPVELQPGESGAGLMARAFRMLDLGSAIA